MIYIPLFRYIPNQIKHCHQILSAKKKYWQRGLKKKIVVGCHLSYLALIYRVFLLWSEQRITQNSRLWCDISPLHNKIYGYQNI